MDRSRPKAVTRAAETPAASQSLDRGPRGRDRPPAHAELVTRKGLYARLIRRQLGAREAVAADGE